MKLLVVRRGIRRWFCAFKGGIANPLPFFEFCQPTFIGKRFILALVT